jgi:hypothetical protein
MCLVREEMASVFAIVWVLWLSQRRGIGLHMGKDMSDRKTLIQIASLTVFASA